MDYDPAAHHSGHIQSLSAQLAVTSIKVTDAPGVGSHGEGDEPKNNKMYVIETVAHQPSDRGSVISTTREPTFMTFSFRSISDEVPSASSLAAFKQR